MIVIADTTPLNYLILIDLTRILSELFGQVVIPQNVIDRHLQKVLDKGWDSSFALVVTAYACNAFSYL